MPMPVTMCTNSVPVPVPVPVPVRRSVSAAWLGGLDDCAQNVILCV